MSHISEVPFCLVDPGFSKVKFASFQFPHRVGVDGINFDNDTSLCKAKPIWFRLFSSS